jgi:putative protease
MNLELLSPAGDFEKLKYALAYGADAVYAGLDDFGLRAASKNFSLETLQKASEYTHSMDKQLYVTLNAYLYNNDFYKINEILKELNKIKIDAVIISDPGLLHIINKMKHDFEVHLSTQANCTNKFAAKFWEENGVDRIILAREVRLKDIKEIKESVDIKIEAFVHGAMCMAYSGRCILSAYINGRSANRGLCTQPCRWEYELYEKTHNDYFPISQDKRGTYILSSKDMNMIEYLNDLEKAGIDSIKIEGRTKSIYYVATVTRSYKMAIDGLKYDNELEKIDHRKYFTGFYFDNVQPQDFDKKTHRGMKFCGEFLYNEGDYGIFIAKNYFTDEFKLEVISPKKTIKIRSKFDIKIEESWIKSERVDTNKIFRIPGNYDRFSLLRGGKNVE